MNTYNNRSKFVHFIPCSARTIQVYKLNLIIAIARQRATPLNCRNCIGKKAFVQKENRDKNLITVKNSYPNVRRATRNEKIIPGKSL